MGNNQSSGNVYNDAQLIMATQVAYLDANYCPGTKVNVGDMVDHYLSYGEMDANGNWVLKSQYQNLVNSKYLSAQLGVAANIQRLASENPSIRDSWKSWTIIDLCNDNDMTGYCGCLIDTGNNHAIIANRGSESYDDKQSKLDWINADIGLLDSSLTDQQRKAQQYMERLYYKYGDQYSSFSVTGHSLGGNLAEHMTIHAPAAMREKIDRCVSFDGPGFSQEYLEKNKALIEKTSYLLERYQWSWVSSLLFPPPGEKTQVIQAHDDNVGEKKLLNFITIPAELVNMVFRHDVHNVEFDEYGNVQDGSESGLSVVLGPLSRLIELIDGGISLNVGPQPLALFIGITKGIKLIRDAVGVMNAAKAEMQRVINNIYYNYIAPHVSGNYEVVLSGLGSIENELLTAHRQLRDVDDELERIRRRWPYNSATGAYYRSRLFAEKCGLELDISRLKNLAAATGDVARIYQQVDRQVEEKFF